MGGGIFESKSKPRKRIVVLVGNGTAIGTRLEYLTDDEHEIYVMSNYRVYLDYFESLIRGNVSNVSNELNELNELNESSVQELQIVLVFTSFEETLPLLHLLSRIDKPLHKEASKAKFCVARRHYLRSADRQDDTRDEEDNEDDAYGTSEPMGLGVGQADRPMSFDIVLLLDSSRLSEDFLSPSSVSVQQILRFASLKHAAPFGIISNTQSFISSVASVTSLLHFVARGVVSDRHNQPLRVHHPEPMSIYDEDGVFISDNLFVNLLIPLGWDSWNKIELLVKSAIHTASQIHTTRLLSSMEVFSELNKYYDEYLASDGLAEQWSTLLNFILVPTQQDPHGSTAVASTEAGSRPEPLTYVGLLKEANSESYYHTS